MSELDKGGMETLAAAFGLGYGGWECAVGSGVKK
jgi:hypothetical protein